MEHGAWLVQAVALLGKRWLPRPGGDLLCTFLTMPSIKKTMEKVMGPSPGQRVRTLQEELTRIREEGAMVRQMMSQIIEERAAREADLERIRERMRIAGLLSREELEVMFRAEERLRRGGMLRENSVRFSGPRRTSALPAPDRMTLEDMVAEDLGVSQYENMSLGPLRMVEVDGSERRSMGWWCGVGMVMLLLVVVLVAVLVAVYLN